ncbi:MAG: hypothetical protein ACYTFD_04585 [Planctomycetota bacterium]|jgi:hypothetical protein
MRARLLLCLLLAAACGDDEPAAPPAGQEDAPADGFLAHLPQGVSIAMRLPTLEALDEGPEVYRALLHALGRDEVSPRALFFAVEQPDGVDRRRAPGLALLSTGSWAHYLPAQDKAALNQALRPRAAELYVREVSRWIVLSRRVLGAGEVAEPPLPSGRMALRVRHHPLLSLLAQPGDTLELGLTLGGGGFDFHGRLRPGEAGDTSARLARTRAGAAGLLDHIPSSLAVRLETTLPPLLIASFLTRRLAYHGGLKQEADRVLIERFLREVLTGIDAEAGCAVGLEFRDGQTSLVVLGSLGPGPPSPILAKLRRDERSSFGALVLDRRDAPAGLLGWAAWVAEPEPRLEELPQCTWGWLDALSSEEKGLPLAYARWKGSFVVAAGPRADLLARAVRSKLAWGGSRSLGSFELLNLRQRGGDLDYVLGAVLAGSGLDGLPPADRQLLAALFGARPAARAPQAVAIAGFRRDGELAIEGRARY